MAEGASTTGVPTGSGWGAAATLAERELVRFFRQRNRVFGALGQPIIFWGLFSLGLQSRQLGFAHFFPGTLAMILLFTAIFATISIIEDRREGFLQSVLVAPAPRWAMVVGKIAGGAAIALLQALLFLVLGWFTLTISSGPGDLLMAVLLMGVMAVALTGLGFAIAWRMDSTHGFHAIMSVFLLPMWLLSGAFFPADGGPLEWVIRLNPLTYGVAGLRHYLTFGPAVEGGLAPGGLVPGVVETAGATAVTMNWLPPLPICWLVTLGFAAVTFALSWRIAGSRTTGDLL